MGALLDFFSKRDRPRHHNRIAVGFLGCVALGCVAGVIWIALEEPGKTTTTPTTGQPPTAVSQQPATDESQTSTNNTSSTALSVLATVASAAVGGIAGMLTAARPSDSSEASTIVDELGK